MRLLILQSLLIQRTNSSLALPTTRFLDEFLSCSTASLLTMRPQANNKSFVKPFESHVWKHPDLCLNPNRDFVFICSVLLQRPLLQTGYKIVWQVCYSSLFTSLMMGKLLTKWLRNVFNTSVISLCPFVLLQGSLFSHSVFRVAKHVLRFSKNLF